ncbi:hypothetical protein H632_c4247p0, partial [Helicosporidium sp. ATCC 50920]
EEDTEGEEKEDRQKGEKDGDPRREDATTPPSYERVFEQVLELIQSSFPPADKGIALRFVLETCADPLETGVRDLAVRLVVNRLLDLSGGVEGAVLEFAGADMDALAALEEGAQGEGEEAREDQDMAEEERGQEEVEGLSGEEKDLSGDGVG